MTTELVRQMVFECAVELLHHSEGLTDEQIANKLLSAIHEADKIQPPPLTPKERALAIQVMDKLIEVIKEEESNLQKMILQSEARKEQKPLRMLMSYMKSQKSQ